MTFATQGALDVLPIHAAWKDENGARRHLIEDRVVRFAPGLTALSLMRQRTVDEQCTAARERSLAAFVAPVWAGIGAREELIAARDVEWLRIRALPWASIRGPFVGENATAEAFLALMNDAAMAPMTTDVLLSAHALFDPVIPANSALVFAGANGQRASLSVADLLALKPALGLDHVAMPACRSAQSGLQQIPDESIGLVSATIQQAPRAGMSCAY